ncbi:hypothetical protein [Nocardia sp. XZ_19_385]|nr:hypothetical protein [Nocardia sp. XZ_19_385]
MRLKLPKTPRLPLAFAPHVPLKNYRPAEIAGMPVFSLPGVPR